MVFVLVCEDERIWTKEERFKKDKKMVKKLIITKRKIL